MSDQEGAAKLAAIASLPIGWVLEDPRRLRDNLGRPATGPDGDEVEVSGGITEEKIEAADLDALRRRVTEEELEVARER